MSSIGSPQPKHVRARVARWWLTAAVALLATIFGFWGQWTWEEHEGSHPDVLSIAYHTLQLFILHAPHLKEPVPWQLHVGRWGGALALLLVIVSWLRTFVLECRLAMTRWQGGHSIVCGLGRMGTQLALGFQKEGKSVVAIEADPHRGGVAKAADAGVFVIQGDPADPAALKRAGLTDAARIVFATEDEQKNVAIASVAGRHLKGADREYECWLFFENPHLRASFQQHPVFPPAMDLRTSGLDPFEITARQALSKVPLDFQPVGRGDSTRVHLVLVGFGRMGQQLALQAARIGHFANLKKLRITVIERTGSGRIARFLKRSPKFEANFRWLCDFQEILLDLPTGDLDPAAVVAHLPAFGPEELATIAACWDTSADETPAKSSYEQTLERDDPASLSIALAAAAKLPGAQVLMFQTRKDGFARAFLDAPAGGQRIVPFGMPEEIWTVDTLLHEKQDEVAKALHLDYLGTQLAVRNIGDGPALQYWPQLAEHFKDSNRRAADHIPVKLRAVGFRVEPLRQGHPGDPLSADEVELLAEVEHQSWWAEWLLRGYTNGPKPQNDVEKTKPHMVPWQDLPDDVKEWDRSQVRAIPGALAKIGMGIYRL